MDPVLERRAAIESLPDPEDYSALLRLVTDRNHRFVVSLGGGATAGLCGNVALVGLLEELGLREYVNEVWGTSAGAIVGAGWASGTPAMDILSLVQSLNTPGAVDFCRSKLILSALLRPFGWPLPEGLVYGRRFASAIDAGLRVKCFEDCPIRFRCIACADDGTNRRKVFRRGPLLPAIFSSMSIPGIVQPRPRLADEECGYYDGGLIEKTPLISPIADHLRSGDSRTLLLLATHFGGDMSKAPARGFIQRFIQTVYSLEDALWEYQLEEARRKHKSSVNLLLLQPRLSRTGVFDFTRTEEYYLRAREICKDRLRTGSLAFAFGAG